MGRTPAWRSVLGATSLFVAVWACTDRISAPGKCPDLCPADSAILADTVLLAPLSADTSIRGFTSVSGASILVVSSLDSLQAVAFLTSTELPQTWSPQTDTGTVTLGSLDSVQVQVYLGARDTSAKNLYILVYRLPASIDTTIDAAGAAQYFTNAALVDSIPVDDTLTTGLLTKRVPANLMVPLEADSFRVAVGFGVRASKPTAVLLESSNGTTFPPKLFYFARGAPPRSSDSLVRTFELDPEFDTYLVSPAAADPSPGSIVVGNQPAARALLHVQVPSYIIDSSTVIRGRLVLHLTRPVTGVPGQQVTIEAAPVLRYFGGKSLLVPDTTTYGYGTATVGDSVTVTLEIAPVLRLWKGTSPDSLPRVIELRASGEYFNLSELTAAGSSAGALGPQLSLTIVRPFRFGVP